MWIRHWRSKISASVNRKDRYMTIYIDESGSINNHMPNNKYFIVALVNVTNRASLKKSYKRFVSSNFNRLLELDGDKLT